MLQLTGLDNLHGDVVDFIFEDIFGFILVVWRVVKVEAFPFCANCFCHSRVTISAHRSLIWFVVLDDPIHPVRVLDDLVQVGCLTLHRWGRPLVEPGLMHLLEVHPLVVN